MQIDLTLNVVTSNPSDILDLVVEQGSLLRASIRMIRALSLGQHQAHRRGGQRELPLLCQDTATFLNKDRRR